MLDRDLADLYGVETKRLNEQVRRNIGRFPADFMLHLTREEKEEVVANCDHLQTIKYSKVNPFAFTEHGVVMLASVLNSEQAVKTSIMVVKVFVQLRKNLASNEELNRKINALELRYDASFNVVFKALRELVDPPKPPRRQIGFVKKKENEEVQKHVKSRMGINKNR